MALRVKKQATSIHKDVETSVAAADIDLLNRNTELETLNTNLKRLLDVSRRRERKLVKLLEELNAEQLLSLDLDECSSDEISAVTSDTAHSFYRSLVDRTLWLIGLLIFQSLSSFILRSNESLLQKFPAIVYFLTMLVGAGGNAGNQATVRVIRGLALGSLSVQQSGRYIVKEISASILIGLVLGLAGLARVYLFSSVAFYEAMAISLALVAIVVSSIVIGTVLPLIFQLLGIDPAHSSTTIQVIMDISGVLITCSISAFFLGDVLSGSDANSISDQDGRDRSLRTVMGEMIPTLMPSVTTMRHM
jgi:cation transporter-like permease